MYPNFREKNNDFNLFVVIDVSIGYFDHFVEIFFYGYTRPSTFVSLNLCNLYFEKMGITN